MKLSKRGIAISTAALIVVGSGVAYAYYSTTDAGTGSAVTENPAAQVIQADAVVPELSLGETDFIAYSATAPVGNTGPAHVQSVGTPNISVTLADSSAYPQPTCPVGSFTWADAVSEPADIAPGATTRVGYQYVTFHNLPVAQDGCKGATITATFTTS